MAKLSRFDPSYDYIFGFGSIINTDTHAPWLSSSDGDDDCTILKGQRATILAKFGYSRGWTFRSNTGFTALGIQRDENATNINGVLFRIKHEMMDGFDRREVGYDRVEINRDCLELIPPNSSQKSEGDVVADSHRVLLDIQPGEKIWVYVPQDSFCAEANEDHPILQSYVDTVLQGCLAWGGTQMAADFVASTSNWSPYFLNDTPSSRRPWLFRKEYETIDRILRQNPATRYADRRHPEEFATAYLIKMMRGSWSVPRRNSMFTGRDSELKQIHAALTSQSVDQATSGGISKLEIAGMGGVGKSQIVIEYCYRYFPSYYGLVIWLGAQSAESIAAGYRQLMADTTGMDVNDKDTDEVVAEVKARLFRSKIPWLLVFDNLEDKDHSLLEKFVPNGGKGHVLVTTRLLNTDNVDFGDQTMILGCFNPTESVELLCRAAGKQNISSEDQLSAANELAECVGHLPLAVGIAAAYMKRCDVDCVEYLVRYKNSGIQLGHEAVSSSLSLSLEAIKAESPVAWEALRLLCWLGPDQITKKLLRALFLAKIAEDNSRADAAQKAAKADTLYHLAVVSAGLVSCSALIVVGRQNLSRSSGQWRRGGIGAVVILSCIVFVGLLAQSKMVPSDESLPSPDSLSLGISGDVFEQTDLTWDVLKSFSILVVKQGVGSMHRLLAQALRRTQNEPEARHNLAICLHTMSNAWTFQPEKIETWQGSTTILEHVKAVVNHSVDLQQWTLDTATMSKEAGVFSAMALNRFKEAQAALEESLLILNRMESSNSSIHLEVRAETLYELGRVFRYEGNFSRSEESLRDSLRIFNRLARNDANIRHKVAATLHELGVLEVKKHNLDLAATFLQQALDLRRTLELESPSMDIEADCASTLHQLAAVHVAQKPPALENAEVLLKEALGLNMQLYQRAGTLKLKARVAIRRGDFNLAERSLAQALELYFELYGESSSHINIAAVKFQQGTLAFQREQYEQAWDRFFECLRARRQVYAYSQGNHLEVSSVLHKLGCVAFVQKRIAKACEMLMAEKDILVQLSESSERPERLVQARLTNLTWLRKCAKEVGDDDKVRSIIAERAKIELDEKLRLSTETIVPSSFLINPSLQRELLECRVAARQYALSNPQKKEETRQRVNKTLTSIWSEIEKSPDCSMKAAAIQFHRMITDSLSQPSNKRQIFEACDSLRDTLREHGIQVVDAVEGKK